MKFLTQLALSFIFLLSSSCGYHFSHTSMHTTKCPKRVMVPYVKGDLEGRLTSDLIYALSSAGLYKYAYQDAPYVLEVSVEGTRNEEIGYNRSITNGQVNKWIVPNENRLSMVVSVQLIEKHSGKVVLGPKYVSASVDYDYDPDFNTQNLVRFSLSQYNFQQVSARMAQTALNKRLSKSIVEYLNYAW